MNRGNVALHKRLWGGICAVILFCAAVSIASSAQTFTTFVSFNGSNGQEPTTLIQGFDGNFYGTTQTGVATGQCQSYYCGTVFKITPAGALTTLHSFCTVTNCPDGQLPFALTQAIDGNLYGVTLDGGAGCQTGNIHGCGTLFRVTPAGKFTTLYSFCVQTNCPDGSGPTGLMQGADGALYGTAAGGGANGFGTVFRVTAAGLKTLHSFNDTDGAGPFAGVMQGNDGNFYGTAWEGGNLNCALSNFVAGCGTLFKMNAKGAFQTLYTFCTDFSSYCPSGSSPTAGMVQGPDGYYYGTSQYGGHFGDSICDYSTCGTIFKMTSSGTLTQLYQFCSSFACTDGVWPSATLVLGTDTNLYGTASGGDLSEGVIFSITPGGAYSRLYSFSGTDGAYPGALMQATNGTFYGTTSSAGPGGYGTIFSLSMGLSPFVVEQPAIGRVGEKILITGTNLKGTTLVQFNGTAAQFTMPSRTLIVATVPSGASTGLISVTGPNGALSTKTAFTVIP